MEPRTHSPAPDPARRAPEGDDAFLAWLERLARHDVRALRDADARRLLDLGVKLAHGRSADDLRIGEALWRLRSHDMLLGYNGVGDLALGELGIDGAQGRWLAAMAEKLAARPLLRAAVVSGAVTLRKADAVVEVATGEHEAYWVARARHDTVHDLEEAAREGPVPDETDWRNVLVRIRPEYREHVEYAFDVARVILDDPGAPRWRVIEAISMEAMGGLLAKPGIAEAEAEAARSRFGEGPVPARASTGSARAVPVPAPSPLPDPVRRPRKLLRELKALVLDRLPDDERLGRAIVLLRRFGAWRLTGADRWDDFCKEHLGLAPSTVRQRAKLEQQLRRLPPLREALRAGRVTYEQARAVARVATPADVEDRIAAAGQQPTLDTVREASEESERQMWHAGRLEAPLPASVDSLFGDVVSGYRRLLSPALASDQALFLACAHFTDVWEVEALRRVKATDPVKLRDRGRCQVPGCSHRAEHLHHVRFRSRGGTDDAWNLVSVCTAHHLAGIHQGYIVVSGKAPDRLVWEFPGRDFPEPVAEA